jgi:hypothetical protein
MRGDGVGDVGAGADSQCAGDALLALMRVFAEWMPVTVTMTNFSMNAHSEGSITQRTCATCPRHAGWLLAACCLLLYYTKIQQRMTNQLFVSGNHSGESTCTQQPMLSSSFMDVEDPSPDID